MVAMDSFTAEDAYREYESIHTEHDRVLKEIYEARERFIREHLERLDKLKKRVEENGLLDENGRYPWIYIEEQNDG